MTDELKPVRCGCGGEAFTWSYINTIHTTEDGYGHTVYCSKCNIETQMYDTEAEAITAWNRAMSAERKLDEWCTDCKEYDQEKQCCHRWNRVIKYVVDEVREKYDERTAKVEDIYCFSNMKYGCCSCGKGVHEKFNYCPLCGARLEWE